MATTLPSHSDILALSFAGQENNVPAAEERAQESIHRFLSLAPTTSASYPLMKASPAAKAVSSGNQPAVADEALVTAAMPIEKNRRSSSLSSDGSLMQKRRFLKLGPVHFGVSEGDWSEEVVE
ncbi:uncharacterized protein RAG0_07493 [Rhynchosporium agropyri]|uniref:Uncharacterized protein n=1 Tax=Rhynchosporium agropyri TaxID=914238 RepID=A0A1E1KLR4_9HELO|nr:uncharacterized protein RAG0_07493 [Rhynchosporium agropyri]